jgi:hypothetical protein
MKENRPLRLADGRARWPKGCRLAAPARHVALQDPSVQHWVPWSLEPGASQTGTIFGIFSAEFGPGTVASGSGAKKGVAYTYFQPRGPCLKLLCDEVLVPPGSRLSILKSGKLLLDTRGCSQGDRAPRSENRDSLRRENSGGAAGVPAFANICLQG